VNDPEYPALGGKNEQQGHNQSKMATFSSSKSWFFRALHENNIALNIRRILMLDLCELRQSLLKLYGYTRKAVKVFRGVGRFCKKAPQFK
jgi:hypothetical protein